MDRITLDAEYAAGNITATVYASKLAELTAIPVPEVAPTTVPVEAPVQVAPPIPPVANTFSTMTDEEKRELAALIAGVPAPTPVVEAAVVDAPVADTPTAQVLADLVAQQKRLDAIEAANKANSDTMLQTTLKAELIALNVKVDSVDLILGGVTGLDSSNIRSTALGLMQQHPTHFGVAAPNPTPTPGSNPVPLSTSPESLVTTGTAADIMSYILGEDNKK